VSTDTPTGTTGTADDTAAAAIDPRLLIREEGFAGYLNEFKRKVRGGELGSLPVVIGLIVIWLVFGLQNSSFFTSRVFEQILFLMLPVGTLSIGLVFVLLLGEIDLSVASVAGLSAAVFATTSVTHGMNDWLAGLLTIVTGALIGTVQGFVFARIGVPAFVVTLAGFLGWQGVMLWLLGSTQAITLPDTGLSHLLSGTSYFMGGDIAGAYILAVLAVAALLGSSLLEQRRRRAAGVPFRPTSEILVRSGLLAIAAFVAAYVLNQFQGVPNALVLFLVLLVVTDFVLRRTGYGRKIFAVGGGIEAARRAGINIVLVRTSVYAISGAFAALAGLLLATQLETASTDISDPNNLMMAIAGAVIGGTSLFGGRGRVWSALLGALVIESISYGLAMLGMNAWVNDVITGAVLLVAVIVDSLSRKAQKASGRG